MCAGLLCVVRASKSLETAPATAFAWDARAGRLGARAVDTGERHVQGHAVDGHDPALLRRTGFGVCADFDGERLFG